MDYFWVKILTPENPKPKHRRKASIQAPNEFELISSLYSSVKRVVKNADLENNPNKPNQQHLLNAFPKRRWPTRFLFWQNLKTPPHKLVFLKFGSGRISAAVWAKAQFFAGQCPVRSSLGNFEKINKNELKFDIFAQKKRNFN